MLGPIPFRCPEHDALKREDRPRAQSLLFSDDTFLVVIGGAAADAAMN